MAKNVKNRFLNAFCDDFQKHDTKSKTIFEKIFPCSFLKWHSTTILHGQMTEKIAFKSWAKKLAKNSKNHFF